MVLLALGIKGFSQDFMTSFPLKMTKEMVAFSFVDKKIDYSYCFVANTNRVKSVAFDGNFKMIDSLSFARPGKEFVNIAGCNKTENAINLFWIAEKNDQICKQTINFKDKRATASFIKLNFEKQKILQSFSTNDKLYLLSIREKSSTFVFHIIDNQGTVFEKEIDLSKTNFHLSTQEIGNLYDVFKENIKPYESSFELPVINLDAPISLSVTSKKRKCYFKENQLIITLDSDYKTTQIITIDLTNFTSKFTSIYSSFSDADETKINSNSLLVDNNLLKLVVSDANLNLIICDLQGNVIKEYVANKSEPIAFMSSGFMTEFVNLSSAKQKVNSTSGFFDELSYLDLGICSYKINDKNLITIGGVSKHKKKQNEDQDHAYLLQFGLIGVVIYEAFINQEEICYDFSRDFCYFYSLLDKNYEKQSENFISYPLESIKNFFNFNTSASLPTLITNEKSHFLGFYNAKNNEYSFLKYNK